MLRIHCVITGLPDRLEEDMLIGHPAAAVVSAAALDGAADLPNVACLGYSIIQPG